MKKIILLLCAVFFIKCCTSHPTAVSPTAMPTLEVESDGERSRKIIGQSVVTSVSVITNGNEEKPYFTDAVGKTVPRPFVPPNVASPINLLNPDRYEFYTFNDKGDLVKRLMTLKEIQSIVANGNGAMISDNGEQSQSVILNTPLTNHDSATKVQDIVDNVQNVLSREMENNKNFSSIPQDLLDTPNVSASWSMILPAIFGNTGDEILPHRPINMTPETEVIDTTTTKRVMSSTRKPMTTPKKPLTKVPARTTTPLTPLRTTTKLTQKVTQGTSKKPLATTKRQTPKPKPTTPYRSTSRRPSPVVIVNELLPEGNEETTKTILITSRPFTTSTASPFQQISTTKLVPTSTTVKKPIVKKPSPIPTSQQRKNVTTIINNKIQNLPVKDSSITKIEMMMPNLSAESKTENESKIEKVTQEPLSTTTVLSAVSPIHLTSTMAHKPPSSTASSMPSSSFTDEKVFLTTNTKKPSMIPTMTTRHPISIIATEGSLQKSTTVLSPIMIESTTSSRIPTVTEAVNVNSEEIRQDMAISQIIGSLQSDMNLNHFYKPSFESSTTTTTQNVPDVEVEHETTVKSSAEEEEEEEENGDANNNNNDTEEEELESEEETTVINTMNAMDKSGNDINLIPDKVFLDNQLYIDEKEPIVKEIPTTTPIPKEDTQDAVTDQSSELIYEKLSSTTTQSKEDDISLANSEVMQTIEKLLQNKIQLQKLDAVSFDDDDETEIKLKDTLNSKEKLSHSEYITKAATIASVINNKIIEHPSTTAIPIITTTTSSDDRDDTTVSTILSEALSNVIEQMIREQEKRKIITTTTTQLPTTTTTTEKYTTTTTTATTTTEKSSDEENDLVEPSLDDLNKLLHHYQELQLSSQRDELQSLSLLSEKNIPSSAEAVSLEEEETTESATTDKLVEEKTFEETSPTIMQKSKISNVQSIEFTTPDDEPEDTTTLFPTTEEPQEFSTFFYVSDDDVSTDSSELGAFTTEQFVVTEKRISNRKDEEITTTPPPPPLDIEKEENDDDEQDDDDDDDEPVDYLTKVLSAIESIGGGNGSDEDHSSTEKTNNSEESDEIVNVISSLSSTLDKTLKTDIKSDFGFTTKIASSLASVADTISETIAGSGDNESEEKIEAKTTVIPPPSPQQEHAKTSTLRAEEKFLNAKVVQNKVEEEETTTEIQKSAEKEFTTERVSETTLIEDVRRSEESVDETTSTERDEETTTVKNQLKKEEESEGNSSLVQLSVIRKEDSLEEVNLVTPSSIKAKMPIEEEGNFIKIESIVTNSPIPKLSGFKNKSLEVFGGGYENNKPVFITQRSTTTTTTTTDTVPSSSSQSVLNDQQKMQWKQQEEEVTLEVVTERVPLIEKATKESSTASILQSTEDNLVQIKVQTKPTTTLPSSTTEFIPPSISTTMSNVQHIKNSIKQQQQQIQHTRPAPIELSTAPKEALGLSASTANLNSDLSDFSKLCNELAFTLWKSITADGISQARSVVLSPFGLTSTLSMIFLGTRGQTSGEMNDLLRLDDTVSFNPHVVFRNISESIEQSRNSNIAAAAFARELYSDRTKGKLLPYFKEKAQQFYGAHVEEVNFNVVNDILRRRTNLLVKKHTYNKIKEYLKTNNIWVNEPLAAVSANVFMTDCSGTTNSERDGEMFFQVSPAIRQRRLVPIPAAVYRSGFTAGYDPILDATAVAFGDDLQSTILVMPGQQGSLIPGDNLERLESAFLDSSDAWGRLLTTFMERPGLEVQIPRFSHRSLINTTFALQQMGLKDIFNANKADLRGLTGATSSDLFFSDLIQINQFTTCGEDKIGDSHHIEIYPSPALKRGGFADEEQQARLEMATADSGMQYKSLFYDPIYDSRYMNVPLSLRPRQARLPENPRLRFDRPFLYFVRHNPTGIILFMGRFNPRLLP